MNARLSTATATPSAAAVALAFLGMFVVGSLGVQLISSLRPSAGGNEAVAPVVAHPSTLWKDLGAR